MSTNEKSQCNVVQLFRRRPELKVPFSARVPPLRSRFRNDIFCEQHSLQSHLVEQLEAESRFFQQATHGTEGCSLLMFSQPQYLLPTILDKVWQRLTNKYTAIRKTATLFKQHCISSTLRSAREIPIMLFRNPYTSAFLALTYITSSIAVPLDSRGSSQCSTGTSIINGRICTRSCGVDRPGGDYGRSQTGSFDACISACAADSKCVTAQYHENNQFCYFKNSRNNKSSVDGVDTVDCDAKSSPSTTKNSGGKSSSSQTSSTTKDITPSSTQNSNPGTCSAKTQTLNGRSCKITCNQDRPGGDYGRSQKKNLQSCAQACAADTRCTSAQYKEDNGFCYFKGSRNGAIYKNGVETIDCDQASGVTSKSSTGTASTTSSASKGSTGKASQTSTTSSKTLTSTTTSSIIPAVTCAASGGVKAYVNTDASGGVIASNTDVCATLCRQTYSSNLISFDAGLTGPCTCFGPSVTYDKSLTPNSNGRTYYRVVCPGDTTSSSSSTSQSSTITSTSSSATTTSSSPIFICGQAYTTGTSTDVTQCDRAINGNDANTLGSSVEFSAEACIAKCEKTPRCRGFSFVRQNLDSPPLNCYLYSDDSQGGTVARTGADTGIKPASQALPTTTSSSATTTTLSTTSSSTP